MTEMRCIMFTFNSTRDMGSMSGKSKFYKNKTKEEIKKDNVEESKTHYLDVVGSKECVRRYKCEISF